MRKVLAAVALVAMTVCGPARAELLSLDEWLQLSKDAQEPSYVFVRCAGIYSGMANYVGTDALGEEEAERYATSIILLSMTAMKIRSDKRGGNAMDYAQEINRDREIIAKMYKKRMHENYAATGQAIMDDALIKGDMRVCKRVAERLTEHLGKEK